MPYVGFQSVAVTDVVKSVDQLTIPNDTHRVEIQADTNHVRYTMDDDTDPTPTEGMLFLTTSEPKEFHAEDLRRIRFVRSAAGNGVLNFHFYSGREVT